MNAELLQQIVNTAVQVGRLEQQHADVCDDLHEASNDLMELVNAALTIPTSAVN